MAKSIKEEMLHDQSQRNQDALSDEQKQVIEHRIRLITLMALANKYCLVGSVVPAPVKQVAAEEKK